MLRSSFHHSEILRTRPQHIEAVGGAPSSTPQHAWSPKTKLKLGRYHLVRVKKPKQAIPQTSQAVVSNGTFNTHSVRFPYDRRLSGADEPRVVRLLNIQPGRRSDPIICELHYVSLEPAPYYEALSYCWGGQVPSVTINCNGEQLQITENLSAALTTLRREDTSLLIWADAICIDQASIEEKSSQVPLMRLIYQNAAVVQLWLGEDTPSRTCEEAFNLLRELNIAYSELGWGFDIFTKQPGGDLLKSCKLPALRDPSWTSLLELAQRPWFARAWIIQEVVVSRNAILRCGSMKLGWKEFCFGFLFAINAGFLSYQLGVLQHPLAYQHLTSLIITYICFGEGAYQSFDLLSLLQSHRLVGATDPRDKVYALLGLSTNIENQEHGLIPNYSLSTAEVYTELSKVIISKSRTLDILGVPRTTSNALIGNVPSWVTDWSSFHLASSLSLKNLEGDYIFDFSATNEQVPKQITFRGNSLMLNGHVFDTIVKVGKVMDLFSTLATDEQSNSKSPAILNMLHFISVMKDWSNIPSSPTRSYPRTSESLLEVYCRTLYMDNFPEGHTLALSVRGLRRFNYRIGSRVISHLCRHPKILTFIEWCESRFLFRYALLHAGHAKSNNLSEMIARIVGRRMVVTESGYLGLAPDLAGIGDCVAIVKGAKVPLILRRTEGTKWELIGDCYVHGIMHGEGFEEQKCVELEII